MLDEKLTSIVFVTFILIEDTRSERGLVGVEDISGSSQKTHDINYKLACASRFKV